MKNTLIDLNNHLYEAIEIIKDDDEWDNLDEKQFERKIRRHELLNEYSKTTIAANALIARCVNDIYGIPPDDNIPLLPKPKEEKFIVDKRKQALLALPKTRDDGTAGYKKGGSRKYE